MSPFLFFSLKKKIKIAKLALKKRRKLIKKLFKNLSSITLELNQSNSREDNLKRKLVNSSGVEEMIMEENAHLMSQLAKIKEENEVLIDAQIGVNFEILRYRTLLDQIEK